jgi:hypothetical protein
VERPVSETGSSFLGRIPVGTPRHFAWLGGIVKAVLVLNLLDAVLTLTWVSAGLAREGNFLLETLLLRHPILFVGAKLGLVSLGSLLLWRKREHPGAVIAIFLIFLAYYLVLLYHVEYASLLVQSLFGSGDVD